MAHFIQKKSKRLELEYITGTECKKIDISLTFKMESVKNFSLTTNNKNFDVDADDILIDVSDE